MRQQGEIISEDEWRMISRLPEQGGPSLTYHFEHGSLNEETFSQIIRTISKPGEFIYFLEDQHDCEKVVYASLPQDNEDFPVMRDGEGRDVFPSDKRWGMRSKGWLGAGEDKKFEDSYVGRRTYQRSFQTKCGRSV